jgi:hypothetical protein
LARRLRYFASRISGTRLQKSQRVFVVDAGAHRFKRIVLRDTYLAACIEQNLERFGGCEQLPELVMRYEHEIWLEYIEGTTVPAIDDALVRDLAALFGVIYARQPAEVPADDSGFPQRLRRDLRFLHRVQILDDAVHDDLQAAVERLTPATLWIGFDYTDPVLKNFIRADDDQRLCAVDVESLESDQLMGTGVAKALLRWLEPYRVPFLDAFEKSPAPPLRDSLPFTELAFLAAYTKLMFLEQKWRNIDPPRFERFRKA